MNVMQGFAEHLVAGVLNSLPAGMALVALTWILLRFMRRASSSARFAVWFSALIALPFLGFLHTPGSHFFGPHTHAGLNLPSGWALPAVAVWIAIAAVILGRIAFGLWRIHQIRRSCIPVAKSDLPQAVVELLSDSSSSRNVEVCTSHLVSVPAAVGIYKPAVVLPGWAASDLSAEQLSVIICHELAHLRRWDDWSNLAQKLLRAVFFFHPAAWWIERELSLAREMACDDAALEHAASARDYAASLLAVAEKSMIRRSILMAQAAVHRARETSVRVARLLKLSGTERPQSWRPAPLIVGALAAAVFVIEPGMPRLIAFQNDASGMVASRTTTAPDTELVTRLMASPKDALVTRAGYRENSMVDAVPANLKTPVRKPSLRPAVHRRQPAPEMLVIFQNASFNEQGMPTWNVYVLRVKWTERAQSGSHELSKRT